VASQLRATCTLLPPLPVRISPKRLALGSVAASFAFAVAPAAGARAAAVSTNHGCYLVGKQVTLTGAGFAAARAYVVTLDGVYFGMSGTDAHGGFSVKFGPGGLPAGFAQTVDQLDATDGTSTASTTFTVTRSAGARFLAARGNPRTLRSPFEVWGFSLNGARRSVYLHYVSPSGGVRKTISLGHTGGQCGYLRTGRRRVFPFAPAAGVWTLQIDTRPGYARHPGGPVARVQVGIA
jgi:hypothetical protein